MSRPWTAPPPPCCCSRCSDRRSLATMRAVFLEDGAVRIRDDVPRPEPAAGEALLRVRLAGLCRTDVELRRGYARFAGIPGHEFVGEVVAAPFAPEWVGRRVVGEINVSCGR